MSNTKINAIIWDYDGTLVDTRHKNLNVTRNIIESICEANADEYFALRSLENYSSANRRTSNWRELYRQEFKLTEKQIDEAGRLWTAYQLNDNTDVTFYEGIEAVIRDLSDFPHGIVSQNSRSSITQNLEQKNLEQKSEQDPLKDAVPPVESKSKPSLSLHDRCLRSRMRACRSSDPSGFSKNSRNPVRSRG